MVVTELQWQEYMVIIITDFAQEQYWNAFLLHHKGCIFVSANLFGLPLYISFPATLVSFAAAIYWRECLLGNVKVCQPHWHQTSYFRYNHHYASSVLSIAQHAINVQTQQVTALLDIRYQTSVGLTLRKLVHCKRKVVILIFCLSLTHKSQPRMGNKQHPFSTAGEELFWNLVLVYEVSN